jgi:hypothetical protein
MSNPVFAMAIPFYFRDSPIFFIVFLVFLLLVGVVFWFYGYKRVRRIAPAEAKLLLKLALWIAGIDLVFNLLGFVFNDRFGVADLALRPILLFRFAMEIVAALVLIRIFYGNVFGFGDKESLDLKTQIERILDSEQFLTILRSTLPRGSRDEVNGLDYIPFLLHNLAERQERFAKRARYCLIATVILGLTFSACMVYFGYILVNEAAAGSGRSLAQLVDNSNSIKQDLTLLLPGFYSNPNFQQKIAPVLDKLQQLNPGSNNKELQSTITEAINHARATGDFEKLQIALANARSAVSQRDKDEQQYAVALGAANDELQRFQVSRQDAIARLPASVDDLKQLIVRVQTNLDKPEYRTPEILKRLAIGFTVATFFIVILRYTSNLYRINYQQELKTMLDDDAARRFYVGFKGSASNDEQRKTVLTAFMGSSGNKPDSSNPGGEMEGVSQENLGILKEIIAALGKKL